MGFGMFRIIWDALDRAHFNTLGRIIMPHALGTFHWIYFVKFNALINSLVRTLRLADTAVDALIGDLERQNPGPILQSGGAWPAGLHRLQIQIRHRPAWQFLSPGMMK